MPVLAYPFLFPVEDFLSWSCSLLFGSLPWLLLEVCFPWTVSPFFWALLVVLLVTFSFSSAFAGHLGSACSCLLDLAGCPCCCFYTCATGCFSFQFLGCACFYIWLPFFGLFWLIDCLMSLGLLPVLGLFSLLGSHFLSPYSSALGARWVFQVGWSCCEVLPPVFLSCLPMWMVAVYWMINLRNKGYLLR